MLHSLFPVMKYSGWVLAACRAARTILSDFIPLRHSWIPESTRPSHPILLFLRISSAQRTAIAAPRECDPPPHGRRQGGRAPTPRPGSWLRGEAREYVAGAP